MIRFKPELDNISPYTPPWAGIDRNRYLRLDLNENTNPVQDEVVDHLTNYIRNIGINTYPDYSDFTAGLAAYCDVPSSCILPTNGSDQGIDLVLRSTLGEGAPMVIARPEFPIFSHVATLLGARIVGVPYDENFQFPYNTFERAITPSCRLIVVINPNNPTGTEVELEYIESLLQRHPTIPILVDEAYFEYTRKTVVPSISRHENLIILRTFSKAYSMAGLRLGYVIAHSDVINQFKKVRGPFDVNCLAMQAASVQMANPRFMLSNVEEVMTRSKPRVVNHLRSRGISVHEGAANFVLIDHPDHARLVAHLKSEGILVRPLSGPRLDGIIRMSVGTLAESNRVIDAFDRFPARS